MSILVKIMLHRSQTIEALKEHYRWRDEAERLQKAFRVDYPTEEAQNRTGRAMRHKVSQLFKKASYYRVRATIHYNEYKAAFYHVENMPNRHAAPTRGLRMADNFDTFEKRSKKEYDDDKKA